MFGKNKKNQKEFERFLGAAWRDSVLATLFRALLGDNSVYLSEKFYLALKDEAFQAIASYQYGDTRTAIITLRNEKNYPNLQIELIQKKIYNENLYFVKTIKSKFLQYNADMHNTSMFEILRSECEKTNK